ncbi:MAG: transcriptional regulator, family [Capsulimonas sp.]|nr:transcriptional regulator, family [Capsulimonas sp.]
MNNPICHECGQEIAFEPENLLPPAEVRRIRRKLRLTQAKAGALLGGGPNAFHKYESGAILPSQAICSTLYILDEFPDALAVLRRRAERNRKHVGR